jgi:hypothetical protein
MTEDQLAEIYENSMMPDTSPGGSPLPGVPHQEITVLGDDDDDIVLPDSQIDSILQRHIQNSTNWMGSQISTAQARAMEYYLGLPEGDLAPSGIQGRSHIVDTTVSDQIEWLMPQLMEIFFASGNIVRFTPRKRGDEQAAQQMTKLVNYIINDVNPGFVFFLEWFKNSLLNKVGVAKVWWEQYDEKVRYEYSELTDDQLAVLSDDPDVVITRIISYIDPNVERQTINQFNDAMRAFYAAMQQPQPPMPPQQAQPGLPPLSPQQRLIPPPPPPPAMPQPPQGAQQPEPPQARPGVQLPGMPPPAGMPPGAIPPQRPPMQPAPMMQPRPMMPPTPPDFDSMPQLHNVVMMRAKRAGRVAIVAMNPEDFLIDERSRKIDDGFCAHRLIKTISELRAAGYPNVDKIDLDQLSSDPQAETVQNSEVMYARESLQTVYKPQEVEDYGDPSQRKVFLYECYLPIDCDGDGYAEWRKITRAGNALLENIIVEGPPFAALCPVPIPGLFFGRSVAELGMPMQLAKTGILRAMVDNMNIQVNGRTWAIESQVNIDDLLTNRPGGVVRVKAANAVGMLQQGMADSQGAYQLLEYLDSASQERSGITKYSQGTDADMLNPTATAYKGITQRADLRTKMMARLFAEGGVKDLIRLVQRVLMKHQNERMTFELDGSWVDVDPQVWNNQYNMRVRVGLGTGDMGERVQALQQFIAGAEQLRQTGTGIITPQNLYYAAKELVEAMQIGQSDDYVTMPPPPGPPGPPPPNPEVLKVQAQAQLENQKFQHQQALDQQKQAFEQRMRAQESQQQHEQAVLKAQLEDARQRDQFTQQQSWQEKQFMMNLAQKREQAAMAAGVGAQQEIAMNHLILQDAEGNTHLIPHEVLTTVRQQNIDSAHRDADRQAQQINVANQQAQDAAAQQQSHELATQAQKDKAKQASSNKPTPSKK